MSVLRKTDEMLENITRSLETWKKIITNVCASEDDINLLKQQVEAYSKLEQEYDKTDKAIQLLDEKLNNSTTCEDVDTLYQDCYESLATRSTINHQDSKVWKAVFKDLSDVKEIRIKKKKIDNDQYEAVDDSLMYSNVFSPPIDPITKVVVRNPCRNKTCDHIYEYDSIVDYIKRVKQKAKCPYIGCTSRQLRVTDLVKDNAMKNQISRYLETHQSETEEDDD
ncbi:E3 SUMO-protein ligase NSE2-like [Diorhabda carinulata]|uniref:E3 SUMO-protein ligase NSE2-like n=1 Tax=Diorhabda carinulata TaxID=1163345 RepID=UPI0025A19AE3|nr:E3 SUMO-protein ligase NSE2-like [Diorhabda carinulata]